MILRRWQKGISPVDFSPKELPVWVTFKKVPPALITPLGVSWVASQIGQPINKFICDGLDIKVCVVRDVSIEPVSSISVDLEDGEVAVIQIEFPEVRKYNKSVRVWKVTANVSQPSAVTAEGSSSGIVSSPPLGGEGASEAVSLLLAAGGRGKNSEATSRVKEVQRVLSPSTASVAEDGTLVSEDEIDEEIEMEKPIAINSTVVATGKTAMPKPASVRAIEKDLVATEPERVVLGVNEDANGGQKISLTSATFGDFFNPSKITSPKGIVTRPKTRRR
ncbi:hypothetical protein LINPERPRIM_LOCUS815 [Linum perenne]